jgi:hypothetical protein
LFETFLFDAQLKNPYIQKKKGSVTQKVKLATGEEIRAGVTKLERYKNGIPVFGSLSDPRMGTNSFEVFSSVLYL